MTAFDVLYVSPHADDVAFSAAGQLVNDVAAKKRVGLLTLFAPEADDKQAPFGDRAKRQAEDRRFADEHGVTLVVGGLDQAPARHKRYRSARRLLAPLADGDERETIAAVQQKITGLLGPDTELVAPLSIGCHVDHQVAERAVLGLVDGRADLRVRFYEDVPYVLVPFALPRRFAQLGWVVAGQDTTFARARFARELRQAASHFARMPFLQAAAPLPFRAVAAAAMVYRDVRARTAPTVRTATAALFGDHTLAAIKRRAAACYDSQWRLFFPSLDALVAELSAYGEKMGHGLVERTWTVTTTPKAD